MPEWVTRDQIEVALMRLGHNVHTKGEDGLITFNPIENDKRIITLDLRRGEIHREHLEWILEWEGVHIDSFIAEIESM